MPSEPTNIVSEKLRLMPVESGARLDKIENDMAGVKSEVADIKKDIRGMKLDTIAEVYKANLSVASFAEPNAASPR